MSTQKKDEEQTDIEIMRSRKMIELIEQSASRKKNEIIKQQHITQWKTDLEFLSKYLYNEGDQVMDIAAVQFPIQTGMIVHKIIELIKTGEIRNRISGRELLAMFRSIGVNIRINTTIQFEDHGKLVSLSDKLKQKYKGSTRDH